MDPKSTNDERLAAAHATLTAAVANVATSEDWQNLLRISGSFHRYSAHNQLLLAAQGAQGLVASFNTWKQILATDGRPCQIRKGARALRVYAPIRSKRPELEDDTGEIREPSVVGFKMVPVFHQGQLVTPPDLPAQPKLLHGEDPPPAIWDAVAEQVTGAGYTLRRGPLNGPDGPKGVTSFAERTVTVRDDLEPAQALKTLIHELGHLLMHETGQRPTDMTRDRMEVEAESVAYVVCDLLGVDAGSYSIPYVANWSGADVNLVELTAHKVLATAGVVATRLEAELGVDLRPNPIAEALRVTEPEPSADPPGRSLTAVGTTDQIIYDHLNQGALDWRRLAASIPALEAQRSADLNDDPAAQAIVLAEAGASPDANVAVLRAHGVDDKSIVRMLTVTVPDHLGDRPTLYDRHEVEGAVREATPIRPTVDGLVAELLVSAGGHPAGARHLAATSGQPSSVINLMEERLRRIHPEQGLADRRSVRGLALIDEWTSDAVCQEPSADVTTEPRPPGPSAA
jgi:hypothetical protein